MNKTKVNYWVDVAIGISFLASAVSGLVFFFDNGTGTTSLGLSFRVWDSLHTWGGMIMIAGVAAHLVLHWNWIVGMTKRMILPDRQRQKPAAAPACQLRPGEQGKPVAAATTKKNMSRRAFMALGGSAAVTTCLVAAGCGAWVVSRRGGTESEAAALPSPTPVADDAAAPVSHAVDTAPTAVIDSPTPTAGSRITSTSVPEMPTPVPTATAVTLGVACRKGMVDDPYPCRCRDYVDRDGDGICDLSVLGSGNTVPRNR